jgi:alkylation response protein AidB-like acyl-CoA dehydrogenase
MFALDDETTMVARAVRQWCTAVLQPRVPALEHGLEQPFDLMKQFAKVFALEAMVVPAAKKRIERLRAGDDGAKEPGPMGGRDRPMFGHVVVKELSRVSPGFAMAFGVSTGLAGGAIVSKGTADQIERWGIPLAACKQIGAWCLTEPGAGSDAFGSMTTTARPEGDGYVIKGQKTFITNGPGADVFLTYARIDRGEPREQQSIAAFILERSMTGLAVGPAFKKMGMRDSPTSEVFFDGVKVGAEHLLGGVERGRGGRGDTKESLGAERSGVPSMCWGIIERCYEASLEYAQNRRQFGKAIGEFQAIQLKIADLFLKLRTVENVVYRLAWMQKEGVKDPAFVSACKAQCSQIAVAAALTSIDIHGGAGYLEELPIEKMARDAKMLELGAGTTDINLLGAARILLGVGSAGA